MPGGPFVVTNQSESHIKAEASRMGECEICACVAMAGRWSTNWVPRSCETKRLTVLHEIALLAG